METKNFGFIECQSPQTAIKILKKEVHLVSGVEIQALLFESNKKSQKDVKLISRAKKPISKNGESKKTSTASAFKKHDSSSEL